MILFIDTCVGNASRTRRLAQHLLQRLGEPYETVCPGQRGIPPLTDELLDWRTDCCQRSNFSDPYFDAAQQFAAADAVVIAAPLWDLSFPAVLKQYLESICINGLTFRYTPEGVPRGLCRAKRLFYVTTAGGAIFAPEFGFGYVKSLAQGMFGIPEVQLIQAEGLDIAGSDPEAILHRAFRQIDELPL